MLKSIKIVFRDWHTGVAHRAKTALVCAGYGCSAPINIGEYYTIHKPRAATYHYAQHPFCRACYPFQEVTSDYIALMNEYAVTDMRKKDADILEKYHARVIGL